MKADLERQNSNLLPTDLPGLDLEAYVRDTLWIARGWEG
jgi:hypothetical protein